MAVDLVPRRILAGEKRAATGGSDRRVDVELSEKRALSGQSIEMRRLDMRMSVAAQIAPTQIIRQQKNHIRWLLLRDGRAKRHADCAQTGDSRKIHVDRTEPSSTTPHDLHPHYFGKRDQR